MTIVNAGGPITFDRTAPRVTIENLDDACYDPAAVPQPRVTVVDALDPNPGVVTETANNACQRTLTARATDRCGNVGQGQQVYRVGAPVEMRVIGADEGQLVARNTAIRWEIVGPANCVGNVQATLQRTGAAAAAYAAGTPIAEAGNYALRLTILALPGPAAAAVAQLRGQRAAGRRGDPRGPRQRPERPVRGQRGQRLAGRRRRVAPARGRRPRHPLPVGLHRRRHLRGRGPDRQLPDRRERRLQRRPAGHRLAQRDPPRQLPRHGQRREPGRQRGRPVHGRAGRGAAPRRLRQPRRQPRRRHHHLPLDLAATAPPTPSAPARAARRTPSSATASTTCASSSATRTTRSRSRSASRSPTSTR